ncbi:uncharacterized protein TRAVEDRAFT_26213 [Trametes versicolor FP-101664 SS1]|uniref:uncharacterized protein n=1 Tax=Trametes versicolor (strain FP-101664) TaxID=717944 RepID=UPI000462238A|nr:uncharacterized protein TRAVEDRAFT_26213 [Trametes versicolor FP-101664 SS1]EIW62474.1 hypothetical protein TRAVEDRAFT_26213 [Trametes versicolor FP-101664 SS1]
MTDEPLNLLLAMNLHCGCSTLRTQLVIHLIHLASSAMHVAKARLGYVRIRLVDWSSMSKNPASAAGDLSDPLLYAAQGICRIDRSAPFYDVTGNRFGDGACSIPSHPPRIPIRRLVPRCVVVCD